MAVIVFVSLFSPPAAASAAITTPAPTSAARNGMKNMRFMS